MLAMVFSAMAHRRLPVGGATAAVARRDLFGDRGRLMGFFYPQLMRAISPNFNTDADPAGDADALRCAGLFRRRRAGEQRGVEHRLHARGQGRATRIISAAARGCTPSAILGGAIWMLALSFNVIACGVAGPAISYALGQGATLVAAIWGVFIWREFAAAPAGTGKLIAAMFAGYAVGLVLIGAATQ